MSGGGLFVNIALGDVHTMLDVENNCKSIVQYIVGSLAFRWKQ